MRKLVGIGLFALITSPAFAAPTLRDCDVTDPLPAGVTTAPGRTAGATLNNQPNGWALSVVWSSSFNGPNYAIYRGNGTSYIVTSVTSTERQPRCAVVEDPAGELEAIDFAASVGANTITIAHPSTGATLEPIRTDGLHLFVFARRGADTIAAGNTVPSNLYAYLVGGSDADSISSNAGITCAMGSGRAGVTPAGEAPDYTTLFATELDRFTAECVPQAAPTGFPDGNDTITLGGDWAWAWGGEGADTLYGTDGDDELHGELSGAPSPTPLGSDTIYGGDGDDWIRSGSSNDTVYGEDGDDVIYCDKGNDQVWAGNGDDVVFGGDGTDTIWAGAGNDLVRAGDGDDVLEGEAGDDVLCGGSQNDTYRGGADVDTLFHILNLGLDSGGEAFPSEAPDLSDAGSEAGQSCSAFSHDQDGLGVAEFGEYPALGTCDNVLSFDAADEFLYCPDPTTYGLP